MLKSRATPNELDGPGAARPTQARREREQAGPGRDLPRPSGEQAGPGRALRGQGGEQAGPGRDLVVNPYNGRPCGCGSRGCLEAEVGERALLDAANRPAALFGRAAVRTVAEADDPPARTAVG